MFITVEKAVELLTQGAYTRIRTTDGKIAIVPQDKAGLKISSIEAINMMLYMVRSSNSKSSADEVDAEIEKELKRLKIQAEVVNRYHDLHGASN